MQYQAIKITKSVHRVLNSVRAIHDLPQAELASFAIMQYLWATLPPIFKVTYKGDSEEDRMHLKTADVMSSGMRAARIAHSNTAVVPDKMTDLERALLLDHMEHIINRFSGYERESFESLYQEVKERHKDTMERLRKEDGE